MQAKRGGAIKTRREHEHFIMHNTFLALLAGFVGKRNIEIAVVTRVGGASKVTFHRITFVDSYGVGSVEHGLSTNFKLGTTQTG